MSIAKQNKPTKRNVKCEDCFCLDDFRNKPCIEEGELYDELSSRFLSSIMARCWISFSRSFLSST